MKKSTAIVTSLDKARLEPFVAGGATDVPAYTLRTLLERARVLPPARVPPDVVTMNSQVLIRDPRDGAADLYTLGYPDRDGPDTLSVLSPLGSSVLAAREGEAVSFMGARTQRTVILEQIAYQPERAGDFEL